MVDEGTSSSSGELTLDPPTPARGSRHTALWGALAAVAVAVGALAVTSAGGGSGKLPQLPVALGSSGGGAREAAMSADTSMAAWITYVPGQGLPTLGGEAAAYRATGTVDEASVRGLAEALSVDGEATHRDGLWEVRDGDRLLSVFDGSGGSWSYGVEQDARGSVAGSAGGSSEGCTAEECAVEDVEPPPDDVAVSSPTTSVLDSGAVGCQPGTKCVEPSVTTEAPCPVDPGAACPPPEPMVDPTEPTPPADLPSEDEARRIALDLLAATGMDVEDAKVTVDGPYDAWYVSVEPRLDGIPVSGWYASVSVGSKGTVLNANGTLTEVERLGDYPVLHTTAAIDRLNAQQGQFQSFPMDAGTSRPAVASAGGDAAVSDDAASSAPAAGTIESSTAVTSIERTETGCKVQPDGREICELVDTTIPECVPIVPDQTPSGDVPAIAQCVEPAPMPMPEPMPEPEPMEVVLADAERILILLPALDESGDTYLVPGYRMSGEDGSMVDVPAVEDESLAPTTTVPEETPQTEPAPLPTEDCDVLVEGEGSGTTHTTHTMNPCRGEIPPSTPEITHLSDGEAPALGVAYHVDVETHCGTIVWAGRWWRTAAQTPLPWASPTEGGAFTLDGPDEGTFVGDADATRTATFTAQGPAADIPGCV